MKQVQSIERVLLAFAALLAAAAAASPAAPGSAASAALHDTSLFVIALLALVGARRLSPDRQRPWLFVSAGCFCFAVAALLSDVYVHVWHRTVPLPSAADLPHLAAYPLILLGALELIRNRTSIDRINALFDTATLAMAISLIVWEPLLLDAGRSVFGALVAGAYPVADIALIGLAGILLGARRISPASAIFLAGSGIFFIGDLTLLVREANGTYAPGAWPDPLFVVAPLLLALAPWLDELTSENDALGHRRPRPVAGTLVVIAALVALPIDVGSSAVGDNHGEQVAIRVLLRVALLAFVAARLLRQAIRNQHLLTDVDRASTRLASVIENTADAVIFASPDGIIFEWNHAAELLFGFPRDEVIGGNVLDLVRPENAEALLGNTAELAPGDVVEMLLPMEVNGATAPVTLKIATVAEANGDVVGFVAIARDDTRRMFARHARQTLAHLDPEPAVEQFAEALHAFVPFELLSLAAVDDGKFRELARVALDKEAEKFVAVDRSRLIVEGSLDFFGLASLKDEQYVLLREAEFGDYADNVRAAGAEESIMLPLRDPLTGEVRGILALGFADKGGASIPHAEALARVAPDISQSVANMMLYQQQRRTAERLQDLDDLREGFLRMVAHEVRSPLGAISTAASVLRDHVDQIEVPIARELAAGIANGARRLSRLTGDLVDASRAGDGRFPCTIAEVRDFGAVIERAAVAAAGDQRERVDVTVQAGVSLQGDEDRLAQVVTNLVTNALKFSDAAVQVTLTRHGCDAVVTVGDHGPGIAADQEHLLFQRYSRLTPAAEDAPRPSGSGLGLFIARELVAAHGGAITHRPTPGGGATFEVVLPTEVLVGRHG
jgi:PAS domain S-box-containing protein